ncbi:BON domain-containing protein [Ideonella sp.]|uniref:BON domain-containing protein n=1 Tax=Ideonella sp. TaxID=1929293 RepID=UPI002B481D71|nr:BON domain-containing protein [Ideonella sp.]HJV69010.1 BON domain-containing protein [Ideonella sp.]
MNTRTTRLAPTALLALSLVSATLLVACGRNDEERTAGQKLDSAIAKTEQSAKEAKTATENAANRVEGAAERMTAKAEDVAVTAKVNAALAGDPRLSALKINVDTVDGKVSLSGFAPDVASRERATELAKAVNGVVSVDNKLEVANK